MPEYAVRSQPAWASPVFARLVLPFAVATALALFFATRDHLAWNAFTWSKALWWKAMEWYAWAVLCPFVFAVCRKFYTPHTTWGRYLCVQLLAGCIIAAAHVAICATGARIEAWSLQTGREWFWLFGLTFR